MNVARLLEFFESRSARNESLVLVTVVATQGSTYSKAGDMMLIDGNGVVCGMLSGGCLETDLAVRGQVVLESSRPQLASYELAAGDDDVWGLGIGCDGSMDIYLQPLLAANNFEPFASIAAVLRGSTATNVRISVAGGDEEFLIPVCPPPHVLLLGAGPDAVPLARLVDSLGWRCTVVDHRPAYIGSKVFPATIQQFVAAAKDLAATIDLASIDAAVVMSHHLASDRSYLQQLATVPIRYIGLLGPPARKERLLSDLGDLAGGLSDQLYGPAGLPIGGRGPEPIALAVVAQMQQILGESS